MTRTEIQALRERAAQQMMSGMFTDLALGLSLNEATTCATSWVLLSLTAADVMALCDLAEQTLEDEA